jgi:rhodanese-related sulfurtransferase
MSTTNETPIPTVSIDEVESRLEGGAILVDVRQEFEYVEAHVPGALLIPLDQLQSRIDEIPVDVEVLCICRSGGRSSKATEFLRSRGLNAYNVEGGTLAWIESGRAIATGNAIE